MPETAEPTFGGAFKNLAGNVGSKRAPCQPALDSVFALWTGIQNRVILGIRTV
jgi:hypothetical protein